MKVIELLDEIIDIMDTSSAIPLSKKVMADPEEVKKIVSEIKAELPDSIARADNIVRQREAILDSANTEYVRIVENAKRDAAELVENNAITRKANARAAEIIAQANDEAAGIRISALDYSLQVLEHIEDTSDMIKAEYIDSMFTSIDKSFEKISKSIAASRDEIDSNRDKISIK